MSQAGRSREDILWPELRQSREVFGGRKILAQSAEELHF